MPDAIWNMDARAGAATDVYDKGARPSDALDLGTHTQFATSRSYARNRIGATSHVAILRFGPKNEDGQRPRNRRRNKARRGSFRCSRNPLKRSWCGRRGSNPHGLAAEGF